MKLDRLRRPALFAVLVVISGLIVAVALVARQGGGSDADAGTDPATATAAALCEATEQARDDPPAARTTFLNHAREGVHALARRLRSGHPDLVFRILEAKFQVEQDITLPDPAPQLPEHLAELITAVNQALEQLSLPAACAPDTAT